MHRCIALALLGAGNVAPNPMVGAVLVHEGRIIGEGYHAQCGQAHAEVNCINSVADADRHLVSSATLYVSLEPCAHFGKTPPCADFIIQQRIPTVVVGSRDPFLQVDGKGIEKLLAAGVQVVQHVLEDECRELNKRFFGFHQQHRPYVVLKWAQSADGKIGSGTTQRILISNELTNRLVHRWRCEEAAILVGTNTALLDNPSLDVRNWKGRNPVRLVVDMDLRLPHHMRLFNRRQRTVVFNTVKHEEDPMLGFYQVTADTNIVHQILHACYQMKIQSIMVEGGARLLQSFLDDGSWDEARIITNTALRMETGLPAPVLPAVRPLKNMRLLTDAIAYFAPHGRK